MAPAILAVECERSAILTVAELPVIDGSALGWASEIGRAGVRLARGAAGADSAAQPQPASLQQVQCPQVLTSCVASLTICIANRIGVS